MSKPMTTPFNRFWRKFDFNITQRLKGFKFLGIVGGGGLRSYIFFKN